MPATKAKNEAFSIVKTSDKDYELYQKGKLICKTDVGYDGHLFYLEGQPETLFNFDASLLPAEFQYQLVHEQAGFLDWYGVITVSVVRKKILLEYFFSTESDLLVNHDINPLKVLRGAMALAKKAGYEVDIDKNDYLLDNRFASISVYVPAKGNLYQHYQKHLQTFHGFFQTTESAVLKRITKRIPANGKR